MYIFLLTDMPYIKIVLISQQKTNTPHTYTLNKN